MTVIDIAQPARLRYCFACFDGPFLGINPESDADSESDSTVSEPGVRLRTPLSASSHGHAYSYKYVGNLEKREQSRRLLETMKDWL